MRFRTLGSSDLATKVYFPMSDDPADQGLSPAQVGRAHRKQLTARAAVPVPDLYAVLSAALSAVHAGAGYSVLPRSLCQEGLDSGRLVLLHDPQEPPLNTLLLVQRPGAHTNPDVVRVRDRLRQAARSW